MVQMNRLKPFKSVIVAQIRPEKKEGMVVRAAIEEARAVLKKYKDPTLKFTETLERKMVGDLEIGFISYSRKLTPPWYAGIELHDLLNHLLLVARLEGFFAVLATEPRLRNAISRIILGGVSEGFGAVEFVPSGILNAAFIKGETKALWLSGTHRRISAKADNKILSGMDLRDALEPLGDQTYHFTSARSMPGIKGVSLPVGVTPRRSQVWTGISSDWKDFVTETTAILKHLGATRKANERPLPILANVSGSVKSLDIPFDISITPREVLESNYPEDEEQLNEIDKWANRSSFRKIEILEHSDALMRIQAEVHVDQIHLGTVEIALRGDGKSGVTHTVSGVNASAASEVDFQKALGMLRRPYGWKIWFESGHTISDCLIYELVHRDIPFEDFKWADLGKHKPEKEKPRRGVAVGRSNSLFCWVKNHWPNLSGTGNSTGWLACDDRPMETADFIHLATGAQPTLTLIHVKGSGSDNPNREISVSDYEIVTGQAIKNLRYLDRHHLAGDLNEALEKVMGKEVWLNGQPRGKKEMIDAIVALGANYDKRVVVFQPRVTRTAFNNARRAKGSAQWRRLRQLDTLLHFTASACRDSGASFFVLGHNI